MFNLSLIFVVVFLPKNVFNFLGPDDTYIMNNFEAGLLESLNYLLQASTWNKTPLNDTNFNFNQSEGAGHVKMTHGWIIHNYLVRSIGKAAIKEFQNWGGVAVDIPIDISTFSFGYNFNLVYGSERVIGKCTTTVNRASGTLTIRIWFSNTQCDIKPNVIVALEDDTAVFKPMREGNHSEIKKYYKILNTSVSEFYKGYVTKHLVDTLTTILQGQVLLSGTRHKKICSHLLQLHPKYLSDIECVQAGNCGHLKRTLL